MYVAFEEDILPGVVFRVEGPRLVEQISVPQSRRTGTESRVGGEEVVGEMELEFESESGGSRSPSEEIASPNIESDDSVEVESESSSETADGDEERELEPITLHSLALFIQQTLHAPLPKSAEEILFGVRPDLRPQSSALASRSLPLGRPSAHARAQPSGPSHAHTQSDPHPNPRRTPIRLVDVLGTRTKFGGLGAFLPPSTSPSSLPSGSQPTRMHKGRQVWIVKLIS